MDSRLCLFGVVPSTGKLPIAKFIVAIYSDRLTLNSSRPVSANSGHSRRFGERVKSTLSCPSRLVSDTEGMRT